MTTANFFHYSVISFASCRKVKEEQQCITESQKSLREWCRVLIFHCHGCGQYAVSYGSPVYLWAMTVFVLQLASPPVLLILNYTVRVLAECESNRLQLW